MRFKRREQSLRGDRRDLDVATLLDGSVRRAGDRVRIVAQLIDARDRPASLGRDVRPAAHRHLRDSDRRRAADRGRAARRSCLRMSGPGSGGSRPPTCRPTSSTSRAGTATRATPKTSIRRASSTIAGDRGGSRVCAGARRHRPRLCRARGRSREAARCDRTRRTTRPWRRSPRPWRSTPNWARPTRCWRCSGFLHDFDWAGAEQEFKLALELSPGSADIYDHYGWLCAALERYDEALELVQRAQELDPLTHRADVATTLLRAGRTTRRCRRRLRAVEFEPDYARGRSTLGWAYHVQRDSGGGDCQPRAGGEAHAGTSLYLAQLGEAYGIDGPTRGGAVEVLRQLEEMVRGAVRVALPSGLRLHRAGRARPGDGSPGARPTRSGPAACTGSRGRSCSRACDRIRDSRRCSPR